MAYLDKILVELLEMFLLIITLSLKRLLQIYLC
jgi:hypothetical protein